MPTKKKTSPVKVVPPVKPLTKGSAGGQVMNPAPIKKQESNNSESRKIIAGKKNLEKWKWPKGKSGNPKWRKPKSFTMLIEQSKRLWYKQVTKEELREAFQAMIGMDKNQIFKLSNDMTQPWAIHIVAQRFLSRDGYEMLSDMLDRAHGTPTQSTNLSGDVGFTLAGWLLDLERKKQKPEG